MAATGYVRTINRKDGPVLYAKPKLDDGTQPQRRLGKLWTKRTPPGGYLTNGQAEARLAAMLAGDDPLVNIAPSRVTFAQACDERLRYLEHDKQRKPSTLGDYRLVINHDLPPHFGADTPVEDITTADVEQLKDDLLERVSHRTAQKVLVILHGVMARAKRKGWVRANPCEDAEKVTLTAGDTFNILEPEQVFALVRATTDATMAALFTVAAFTGLRYPRRAARTAPRARRLRQPDRARVAQLHPRRREHDEGQHDVRHTFGSLAVRTAPLSDVQAWMGHQHISTTMRYVHSVPPARRRSQAHRRLYPRIRAPNRAPNGVMHP